MPKYEQWLLLIGDNFINVGSDILSFLCYLLDVLEWSCITVIIKKHIVKEKEKKISH